MSKRSLPESYQEDPQSNPNQRQNPSYDAVEQFKFTVQQQFQLLGSSS